MKLDDATLRDLVDEKLPRARVRAIQSAYKDPDRFDQYVALLHGARRLRRRDRAAVRRASEYREWLVRELPT
jgi:acetone carboxylase gamma subunit